ncbi:MAG: hypothetical protein K0U36_02215 [Alphaproteobacteria bacterium]|nr:hypothetical protein [Alphaproteobacteria bacterium]
MTLFATSPLTSDPPAIDHWLAETTLALSEQVCPIGARLTCIGDVYAPDAELELHLQRGDNTVVIDLQHGGKHQQRLQNLLSHANARVRAWDAKALIIGLQAHCGITVTPSFDVLAAHHLLGNDALPPEEAPVLETGQHAIDALVRDKPLLRFYQHVLLPAIISIARMELYGVQFDKHAAKLLDDALTREIEAREASLLSLLPSWLESEHWQAIHRAKQQGRSPITAEMLVQWLFSEQGLGLTPSQHTGTGKPSTKAEHLRSFQTDPRAEPIIEAYTGSITAHKMRSTYVRGFLREIKSDGRLHPAYKVVDGTSTGRLSAHNPPIQTIPRADGDGQGQDFRACFTAPPGYAFFTADYAQGELRVIADVANEENMLQAFADGIDLHAATAARINGVDIDEFLSWQGKPLLDQQYKSMRNGAKAANFGLVYGMGARGFAQYARGYGLAWSEQDAQRIIDAFFAAYPRLQAWKQEALAEARTRGYVQSPLGRRRAIGGLFDTNPARRGAAERAAINTPIQSTLSDITLLAITALQGRGVARGVHPVAMVHDAIYGYLPAAGVAEGVAWVRDCMETLDFSLLGWAPRVKFQIDITTAPSLGH